MTSQLLPMSWVWSRGFLPPTEVKFDAFGTSKHGEGKSLSKISVNLGDLIEQIKKICHIQFKEQNSAGKLNNKFLTAVWSSPMTISRKSAFKK